MLNDVHDECGVAGAYFFNKNENVAPLLYKMLLNLQNRGQLSAGITTYSPDRGKLLLTYKELGTVNEVFQTKNLRKTSQIFRNHKGSQGIGHVRYATFGLPHRDYAHPFERKHGRKYKWFSFCFNGNIANFSELKRKLLEKKEYHLVFNSDTEIIMHYLSREIGALNSTAGRLPDLRKIFSSLAEKFDGGYALAFIDAEGRMAAVRDPRGIRPLCYHIDDEKVLFASESVALENVGCTKVKSLHAGEMLLIEDRRVNVGPYTEISRRAHCMFEYIYFANVASRMEGRFVYRARISLGEQMAALETEPVNTDEYVVISVPDSSKPFGEGYAYTLSLPHREGLIRNRFVGRTFIEGEGRREKIKSKFSIIKQVVQDKKVLLLDDSVIRGNTSRELIQYLRNEGKAKEVHLRVSCPPVVSPCFYGIDMSKVSELVAYKYLSKRGESLGPVACRELAEELGADSLIYQKLKNVPKAIGLEKEKLCMACLDSHYPTPFGEKLYQIAVKNGKNQEKKRTYE